MKRLLLCAVFSFAVSASDNPSFVCGGEEGGGVTWGGVSCTAFNVGNLEPQWETFVAPLNPKKKAAYRTHGWSVHIQLEKRWSLVVMTVTNGKQTAVLRVWARKTSPTGTVFLGVYKDGDTRGPTN